MIDNILHFVNCIVHLCQCMSIIVYLGSSLSILCYVCSSLFTSVCDCHVI